MDALMFFGVFGTIIGALVLFVDDPYA